MEYRKYSILAIWSADSLNVRYLGTREGFRRSIFPFKKLPVIHYSSFDPPSFFSGYCVLPLGFEVKNSINLYQINRPVRTFHRQSPNNSVYRLHEYSFVALSSPHEVPAAAKLARAKTGRSFWWFMRFRHGLSAYTMNRLPGRIGNGDVLNF